MSLPNKLSVFRIFLIPFLLLALLGGDWFGFAGNHLISGYLHTIGLFIVIVATVTDWYDGKIARERGLETTLGKFLDPLADKLFVATAFVAFVEMEIFPSWVIVLILLREFLITGIRMIAASEGRVIPADRWGKHKTGWQLATIITTVVFVTAREFLTHFELWEEPLAASFYANQIFWAILWGMVAVTLFLTVVSGWLYLRRNRDLLKEV